MTNEHQELEDAHDIGMSLAERALYTELPKDGKLADLASDAFWRLTDAINRHEAWTGDPWPDYPPPFDRVTMMRQEREEVRRLL